MHVNDEIEVYFAESRHWYDAVVDAVDEAGACHLKFGDGHESWYVVEQDCVREMLEGGRCGRKLKWQVVGQPTTKLVTKAAKRPLPASPPEESAEEPEQPPPTPSATITKANTKNLELFFRYLNRRQRVHVQMYGTPTTLGEEPPEPPSDDILDLCTSGNAYRHLDKADREEGAAYRQLVGVRKGERPDDEQFAMLLMMCLLRMGMFNHRRMQEWAEQERGMPVSELHGLPCTENEALQFTAWLKKNEARLRRPTDGGPKMWAGAGNQVQGFRWIKYLRSWFRGPSEKQLRTVATKVRAASTWEEANRAVQKLASIGGYSGAQGLCTLVFGVCAGDFSLAFSKGFDNTSLLDWCAYGDGPESSVKQIFGENVGTLEGIRELRRNADAQFKRWGLEFPYLLEADGTKRPLSCVDLEHSLCYFCRYGRARKELGSGPGSEAEKLHRLFYPAIQQGKLRRWKVKELSDLSFNGAKKNALEKMGSAPVGVKREVEEVVKPARKKAKR